MHVMFLPYICILLRACLAKGLRGNDFERSKSTKFVSTSGGDFYVNGSAFKFVGTNAYWLHALNTDQDISNTFGNISAAGIKVVRTWAFNDVNVVPTNGTWFQLISNGTTTINNGPNGLPRLDKVVELAEQHGIYLLLSLTNNWNPFPGIDDSTTTTVLNVTRRDVTPGTNNRLNRNYLCNNYGGMDAYVRHFGVYNQHDEFYSNETIIELFKNYTTSVVSRYVDSPAIFGWELANDPRCNSSLPSNNCTPQMVTKWHSILAQHVASMDPNHIIGSGNHGFFCTGCPKLFPLSSRPASPPAHPSVPAERAEQRRRIWQQKNGHGIPIKGRWVSTTTRPQDSGLGPAFDGSEGVDSEDILGIPQIHFATFQYFPDQNEYEPDNPNLSPFNDTVQVGLGWIKKQAQTAKLFGKPVALTAFGLVTRGNAPYFVPVNSTMVLNMTSASSTAADNQICMAGATNDQRDDAYQKWLQAGIKNGVNGLLQYQWGQSNLTTETGTPITPNSTDTSPSPPSDNPTSSSQDQTGVSPDDGYTTSGIGQDGVQSVLTTASQNIGEDASQ